MKSLLWKSAAYSGVVVHFILFSVRFALQRYTITTHKRVASKKESSCVRWQKYFKIQKYWISGESNKYNIITSSKFQVMTIGWVHVCLCTFACRYFCAWYAKTLRSGFRDGRAAKPDWCFMLPTTIRTGPEVLHVAYRFSIIVRTTRYRPIV